MNELLIISLLLLITYFLFFSNCSKQEYFSTKFQTKGERALSARSISPRVTPRPRNRVINRPIRANYSRYKKPGNLDGSRPRYSGKNRTHWRNNSYYGRGGYYGYPWYWYDYVSPWSWYNYYYNPYDYDVIYEPEIVLDAEDQMYYDGDYYVL